MKSVMRSGESNVVAHVSLVCCALAIAAAACSIDASSTGAVGQPAPQYAASTLSGDSVSLQSLEGRVVLLNVWATWCPPCREETPELQALYERYRDRGLEVVGVSIDGAAAEAAIRTFTEEFGVTYTILHDPAERVSNAFRIRGVPTTVLIGRDGTVLWRRVGPVSSGNAEFIASVRSALETVSPVAEHTSGM